MVPKSDFETFKSNRRAIGITQEEIADVAHVSISTVRRFEAGKVILPLQKQSMIKALETWQEWYKTHKS